MIFKETKLQGSYLIELESHHDNRGFFARTFCMDEFEKHQLPTQINQSNLSFNTKKYTLRGMHFQIAPCSEAKLVSCARGAIYDVIIDIRPESATKGKWIAVELTQENGHLLFIPEGFAHGFQTLSNDTAVIYQMFNFFQPEAARGIRFDDPTFKIEWPETNDITISEKDTNYRDFTW